MTASALFFHRLGRTISIGAALPRVARALVASLCVVLAACGGGSADAPPPPETGTSAVPPTITQQPVNLSVTVGQPASFTVAASGTAPIAWQWQRNGTPIAGATSTVYTLATTAMSDSAAVFTAVATNVAGSATSNDATLTVTTSAPVLTITQQPASTTVVAGTTATFTVAATCSDATLDVALNVQWQRSNDGGVTFANITGAMSTTYSVMTATGDTGARFQAVLDCSGQSGTTSSSATLTVTQPGSVTVSLLPTTGLRTQADVSNSAGIVEDNLYSYSFIAANRIKRLSQDSTTITTLAGTGASGAADGPGTTATFQQPTGIVHDGAGNLFVTDTGNDTIRKIATDGTVSTIAGSAGLSGTADGSGAAARFHGPTGIAIGVEGDLYVADTGNHLIRRVTTAGVVTTFAGSSGGFSDGPATSAQFNAPTGVTVASTGDVYVSDSGNQRVRWVTRVGNFSSAAGNVSTIAGDGTAGTADGVGTAAQIPGPAALCSTGSTLYVSDSTQRIRKIDLGSLAVTTFAGSNNALSTLRNADGPAGSAHFVALAGLAPSTAGGLFVSDGASIRHVAATGTAVTIATGSVNANDTADTGLGTLSQLPFEFGSLFTGFAPGLLVEPDRSIDVLDPGSGLLRRVSPGGAVTTIAGLPDIFDNGVAIDGQASGAQFGFSNKGIARDSAGTLYVVDLCGVRRITTDGTVGFIAGSTACDPDRTTIANGTGSAATFFNPSSIAIGPNGDLFVTDNNEIRRVTPAGVVTTYAGGIANGSVDGPISAALFTGPYQAAFGADGTLYVLDATAQKIRTVSADGQQVATLAGSQVVYAFAVDSSGTLYYSGTGPEGALGLHERTAAGVDTPLLSSGDGRTVVLGSTNPVLPLATTIVVYGPKQLLLSASGQNAPYVVTLP